MVQREHNLDQKNIGMREFPGSRVVKTQCFHCHSLRSVPGWETKILQAAWCGQKAATTLRWNSCFAHTIFCMSIFLGLGFLSCKMGLWLLLLSCSVMSDSLLHYGL